MKMTILLFLLVAGVVPTRCESQGVHANVGEAVVTESASPRSGRTGAELKAHTASETACLLSLPTTPSAVKSPRLHYDFRL